MKRDLSHQQKDLRVMKRILSLHRIAPQLSGWHLMPLMRKNDVQAPCVEKGYTHKIHV